MDLGGGSGRAINNAGQVTGGSNNGHAFLYSNGQMMDLGTLPGFDSSFGRGINSLGQVTGSSSTTNSFFHAFLYSNGQMIDLGTLAGRSTVGAGINDAGQVVGWSDQGLGMLYHAFLYSNGQMMDLNDLIDPSLGITLFQATGINNSGQIVANGSEIVLWWTRVSAHPGAGAENGRASRCRLIRNRDLGTAARSVDGFIARSREYHHVRPVCCSAASRSVLRIIEAI